MIELGVLFLFRRGPGHIGSIEHGDRGGSPAASITGVLRRRESIGVRHPGEGKDDWSRWPAPAPHFLSSILHQILPLSPSCVPLFLFFFLLLRRRFLHRILSTTAEEPRRRRAIRHVCRLREPGKQNPLLVLSCLSS